MGNGFNSLDEEFGTTQMKPKYASEATTKLKDGDHEVQVTLGVMKDEDYGPIVTLLMTVVGDDPQAGWSIEKPYFLTKAGEDGGERVNDHKRIQELKTDLSVIGFDVENWKPPARPFGAQLAIACQLLKGVKLKVKKKQNGEYANLYINKRLEDGLPAKFGAEEMGAADVGGDLGESGLSGNKQLPADDAPKDPLGKPLNW